MQIATTIGVPKAGFSSGPMPPSPHTRSPAGATMPPGESHSNAALADLAVRPDAQLPLLAPATGNRLKLLVDEAQVLPEILSAVRGAKRQIDFSMFSLSDSGAGRELVDALVERSKAGVAVHVTLDQVGSMTMFPVGTTARMLDRLRDAGTQVAINPRITRDGLQAVDHRKLLVVDGTTAFTGGVNFSAKFGKWHDIMVRIDGSAATQFGAHFLDRWMDMTGQASDGQKALIAGAPTLGAGTAGRGDARHGVAMLANKPDAALHASDHLLENLTAAKDRAWILTPTLSDPAVVQALTAAARRGVDVRVAVSGPEGWIGTRALRLIGATFYRELVDAGVKVFEQPGMSHAKASLVDGIASAGSLNTTRRAMLWDHELMLASDDAPFVKQIENLFDTDFERSTLVTPERANSLAMRAAELLRKTTGLRW